MFPAEVHQILRCQEKNFSVVANRNHSDFSVSHTEKIRRGKSSRCSRVPRIQIRFCEQNARIIMKSFICLPVAAQRQVHALSKSSRHIGAGITHHILRALLHYKNGKLFFKCFSAICNRSRHCCHCAFIRRADSSVFRNQAVRIAPPDCDAAFKLCGQGVRHCVGHLNPVFHDLFQIRLCRYCHLKCLCDCTVSQRQSGGQFRCLLCVRDSHFPLRIHSGLIGALPGNGRSICSQRGKRQVADHCREVAKAEGSLVFQKLISLGSQIEQFRHFRISQRPAVDPQIPEGSCKQRIIQILGRADMCLQPCAEIGHLPCQIYSSQIFPIQIAGQCICAAVDDNCIQLPLIHKSGRGNRAVDSCLCRPGLSGIQAVCKYRLVMSARRTGIQQEIVRGIHLRSLRRASEEERGCVRLIAVIADPQRYGHGILSIEQTVRQGYIVPCAPGAACQVQGVPAEVNAGRAVCNGGIFIIAGNIFHIRFQRIVSQQICVCIKLSRGMNRLRTVSRDKSHKHSGCQKQGKPSACSVLFHVLSSSFSAQIFCLNFPSPFTKKLFSAEKICTFFHFL